MWVRLQLDIGWWDLAYGLTRLIQPHDPAAIAHTIEQRWSPDGNALTVLSVRSGLDLLLGAMQWPVDSEIVYSALNIPDMSMVARQHGLVPVPADLRIDHLAPDLDALERAITPRTRAILIAHLYGSFIPLEPIVALAREHNLMLIEDCAENYDGAYHGHPDADVALFSFGPLKTATSLAGGILKAKDADLAARLRINHDHWPRQHRLDYFNRLCKYGTMKFFGGRWVYAEVRRCAKWLVGDVDTLIHHSAKSFRGDEIMRRLRQRPCGPLLASMQRRLANFDANRIAQRTANGRLLAKLLHGKVVCPGTEVDRHNYWLFPAMVTDPAKAIAALESAGFDATHVQSMSAIDAPPDRPELGPMRAKELLEHMILVPCYPGIPESELRRMAAVLIEVESKSSRVEALKVTFRPAETIYDSGSAATRQACADSALAEH